MPRDSSGNYTLPVGNPVVDGTVIDVNWANPTMSDIAVQLNNVVTRDGLLGFTSPAFFVDGTPALPGIAFAAQNGTGLWRDSTRVGISYAGVEKQTWGSTSSIFSGNVGVGTTPNATPATHRSVQVGVTYIQGGVSTTESVVASNLYNDAGGWKYKIAGAGSIQSQSAGVHVWYTSVAGVANAAATLDTRMALNNAGNLGLGTGSPVDYGVGTRTLAVNATSIPVIDMMIGGSVAGGLLTTASEHRLFANGARSLILYTNAAPRASITSSGLFGVGSGTPVVKAHVFDGQLAVADGSGFSTAKNTSTGVAWSTVPTLPSIVFNGLSTDRPEISWYRGGSAFPEFCIREHPTANTGGQILSGTGAGVPGVMLDIVGGNIIKNLNVAVPALGVNNTMVMNHTSNTNLRISVRGTDGVTRVANIALA